MSKDPAFLFYSKDWIESTAEFSPAEKGVFIDLLAHQHQKKTLPIQPFKLAKICHISEAEFLSIWPGIKDKFILVEESVEDYELIESAVQLTLDPTPNNQPVDRTVEGGEYRLVNRTVNRLMNRMLNRMVTERLTANSTNGITARFAVLMREAKNLAPGVREKIKKSFNIADFQGLDKESVTERLTEWFTNMVTAFTTDRLSSAIENANANVLGDEEDKMGGAGGKKEEEGGEPPGQPIGSPIGHVPLPGKRGWNSMPLPEALNGLPEEYQIKAVELVGILQKKNISRKDVIGLWEVFKLQHLTGTNFYAAKGDVYKHFLNHLKHLKYESGEKLGTSAARIEKFHHLASLTPGGSVRTKENS